MKRRLPDLLLVLLLGVALVEGALLALRGGGGRILVPVQHAGDPPGLLMGPGQGERVFHARMAAVGDWLTIEDLVRGALLLQEGRIEGAEPLSGRERRRLSEALAAARTHRDELLAVEGEIRRAEAELAERTLAAVRALTPEQRAWILARRDDVSVGLIERGYWESLARALEEEAP